MSKKQVATLGSMHVCPMCSGTVPHVGGPVSMASMSGVTINGKAVAVQGDMCTCAGAPDTIAQGSAGVTINGTPIATMGSMTAHGGQITQGCPGVTISARTDADTATLPPAEIPFPEIRLRNVVGAALIGAAKKLAESRSNQETLKEEAEENGFVPRYDFSL